MAEDFTDTAANNSAIDQPVDRVEAGYDPAGFQGQFAPAENLGGFRQVDKSGRTRFGGWQIGWLEPGDLKRRCHAYEFRFSFVCVSTIFESSRKWVYLKFYFK